jgi:ketol-acid reductoisomerase
MTSAPKSPNMAASACAASEVEPLDDELIATGFEEVQTWISHIKEYGDYAHKEVPPIVPFWVLRLGFAI